MCVKLQKVLNIIFTRREQRREEKIFEDIIEENSPDLKDGMLPIMSRVY